MSLLGQLMPVGVRRLLDVRKDFKALGLSPNLAFHREWREALSVTHAQLLPARVRNNPALVVDVGGNVGLWTSGIHKLLRPTRIVSFEPVPWVFDELKARTGSLPGVELIQAAVGAQKGTIEVRAERVHQLSSILVLRQDKREMHGVTDEEPQRVTVPMTTLDEHFADEPEVSVIKFDIQGYEPQAFAGGQETLRKARVVVVEVVYVPYYEGDVQFNELHRALTSIAPFALYGMSEPAVDASGQPVWADAVYTRDL